MNSEVQNQTCSDSSRSSEKEKQKRKKIPQRGLGVALLEKIRIEEEEKKIATNANFTPSLPVSSLNYTSSQSPPSTLNEDTNLYLNPIPGPRGFDVGWPSVPTIEDSGDHLHKMWNPYELIHEEDCSNALASSPSLMNIPLMSLPVISNFLIEPPSNQSSYTNFSSFWPEENTKASTKRPYPSPLDMTALPSFHNKLPRIGSTSVEFESTPFGIGSLFNADHAVPVFRETPLMPSSSTIRKNSNKESGNQNGDFLTLAPPTVSSPRGPHSLRITEDPVADSPRSSGLIHTFTENPAVNSSLRYQQSFFNFFSAPTLQQESSAINNNRNYSGNGESGVIIDLNLKL